MLLKEVLEVIDIIDSAMVSGSNLKAYLEGLGGKEIELKTLKTERGSTDFIRISIAGTNGKLVGGTSPTLGVLGRLGGLGARPEKIGMVSDGDGALVVLALAAKVLKMATKGDRLEGDLIISTHICPDAPIIPHEPVAFMGSPVSTALVNKEEVRGGMDAILSVDTTKGNRILNHRGIAITPTVKEGYILRVSEGLLDIYERVTGRLPVVLPITIQDISPYGNGVYHLNSIMQPSTATKSPVVGLALTTEVPVAGSATGASHPLDLELAARFCLELAKDFGRGSVNFYDEEEYELLQELYGSLAHLQGK